MSKTLSPEWNEKLTYHGITESDTANKTLRLTVLDQNTFQFQFIGEARVPLKQLVSGIRRDFNIYLTGLVVCTTAQPILHIVCYKCFFLQMMFFSVIRCEKQLAETVIVCSFKFAYLFLFARLSKKIAYYMDIAYFNVGNAIN